jgi:ketol-acid reductoisomerase
MRFSSKLFSVDTVKMSDRSEQIVKGGRHLFPLLARRSRASSRSASSAGARRGPAQAQNLRDSLEGTGIKVKVGLRGGVELDGEARKAGFSEDNGTLGEMFAVIKESDISLLLISGRGAGELYPKVFESLRPGSTLGLSHGFLIGHLKNVGAKLPAEHQRHRGLPEGDGAVGAPPVRAGQGSERRRHQRQHRRFTRTSTARATDYALGWSVALGSPYTFETTLESEYKSDIYGERGILLGAVHGVIEALYRRYVAQGMSKEAAFLNSASRSPARSRRRSRSAASAPCTRAWTPPARRSSRRRTPRVSGGARGAGGDLRRGVERQRDPRRGAGGRAAQEAADGQDRRHRDLEDRRGVRAKRDEAKTPVNPFTAGVYIATMMAQIDILLEHGHPYSRPRTNR